MGKGLILRVLRFKRRQHKFILTGLLFRSVQVIEPDNAPRICYNECIITNKGVFCLKFAKIFTNMAMRPKVTSLLTGACRFILIQIGIILSMYHEKNGITGTRQRRSFDCNDPSPVKDKPGLCDISSQRPGMELRRWEHCPDWKVPGKLKQPQGQDLNATRGLSSHRHQYI